MAKTKTKEKEKDRDSDKPERPAARSDAYVMMLFITLIAIVVGSVLMYLDHEDYGGKSPPKEVAPTLPKLGEGEPRGSGS